MSTALANKIDFEVLISVTNANPNGDPLGGNRPRTDYDGFGEISDVCIKRKIRKPYAGHGLCRICSVRRQMRRRKNQP